MDPCKNGRAGEVFLCINLQGILVGTPISFVLRKLLAKAMIFVVRHTSSKKCLQRHLYKKGHLCPRGLLHGKKHFLSALCRLSYRRLGVRYGTTQVGKGLLCLVATGNTNGYILQQQLQRLPRSPELRRPQVGCMGGGNHFYGLFHKRVSGALDGVERCSVLRIP